MASRQASASHSVRTFFAEPFNPRSVSILLPNQRRYSVTKRKFERITNIPGGTQPLNNCFRANGQVGEEINVTALFAIFRLLRRKPEHSFDELKIECAKKG